MKYLKLFYALTIIAFAVIGCKKDNTEPKVSIPEGKIVINYAKGKTTYTITDIQTRTAGDTTTLRLEALSEDSTETFFIGFQKIGNFGVNKYPITGVFNSKDTSSSVIYMNKIYSGNEGFVHTHYLIGEVDILEYRANDNLQCKLNFIPGKDTTEAESITGEVYASFALLDPNRVPNLSITPGTTVTSINMLPTMFATTYAGYTEINDMKKYIVTALTPSNQTLTISFIDFTPRINKQYNVGQVIIEGNDSTGLVEASYVENGLTYYANEEVGSGKVLVSKITSSTLQGKFDIIVRNKKDTSQKVIFSEGLFYAKLKNYNVK